MTVFGNRAGWALLAGLMIGSAAFGGEEEVRTIRLKQDDAQVYFASKLYELKHVRATDVLPYVNSAVLRYNANSTIRRVKYGEGGGEALLVSTGREFLPYVDDLIAKIDRPGKVDAYGSVIEGTGVSRIAYTPRYRAAFVFEDIINQLIGSSEGRAYVNAQTNTIFWRDEHQASLNTLRWIKQLDRPLPQAEVRVNYYEVRDSTLRDVGFDYLAWKNGPGVNFFNVGYNAGKLTVDEVFRSAVTGAQVVSDFASSWNYGGFFAAPQFDMSFIRILQQSGNANLASYASLTMVNTPVRSLREYRRLLAAQQNQPEQAPYQYRISMTPEYQNIAKNSEGRSFIGASFAEEDGGMRKDPPHLDVLIRNPVICFSFDESAPDATGFLPDSVDFYRKASLKHPNRGGVIFQYSFAFKNVVERGNTGGELSNSTVVNGAVSLGFKQEKILAVYEKENDVEQTIGLPILCRIPILKYLFSTTTTIKEKTYIVVTAEASLVHPASLPPAPPVRSKSEGVHERREIKL